MDGLTDQLTIEKLQNLSPTNVHIFKSNAPTLLKLKLGLGKNMSQKMATVQMYPEQMLPVQTHLNLYVL